VAYQLRTCKYVHFLVASLILMFVTINLGVIFGLLILILSYIWVVKGSMNDLN
jgi:hypothetical protein